MCGIVGYVGKRNACDILVSGLRRLEYRGYDSAGVALQAGGLLTVVKQTGKIASLEKRLAETLPAEVREQAHLGIAHTRWATHGLPTEVNAHPHVADGGQLALVHNGIIENYASLKRQLEARGCVFVSQTDTEVLAHLVSTFDEGDLLSAVSQASITPRALTQSDGGLTQMGRKGWGSGGRVARGLQADFTPR